MKTLIPGLCALLIGFSSCQKSAMEPVAQNSTENINTAARYFYHGQAVNNLSQLQGDETLILLTDQIDGQAAYYGFDTREEAETYLAQFPAMKTVVEKIHTARIIRDYALSIHENEYVQEHGSNSTVFSEYLKTFENKKRVIQGTIYANVAYGGANLNKIDGVPIAVLPAFIDNNTESARFNGGPLNLNPYTLYNGYNFVGAAFVVAANIPTLWPIPFGNIASSVF
ncbi:MAG TPA: hypothetical protein PLP14_03170 [Chitinophagaceae bacterium]|nr:hypothetical protein [Chitinophagaceae bacterium]